LWKMGVLPKGFCCWGLFDQGEKLGEKKKDGKLQKGSE